MDGIANVARQQQTQVNVQEPQVKVENVEHQAQKSEDMVEKLQKGDSSKETKINSKEEVEDLVEKLNDAMAPISTSIKFGVDSQDVFYVSVIESKTHKMIRRFPAEQASDFLPKMQEVTGILFDTKG